MLEEMYPVRHGAANEHGILYERHFAQYMCWELTLLETIDDFKMLVNVDGVGSWDDVVISITPKHQTNIIYFCQLKHADSKSKQFDLPSRSKKNVIDLQKQFKDVKVVKEFCENRQGLAKGGFDQARLVIFTNAPCSKNVAPMTTPVPCEEYFVTTPQHEHVFQIQHDSDFAKLLVETEQLSKQEFFNKLIICSNQADYQELKARIQVRIKDKYGSVNEEQLFASMDEFIREQGEGKEGRIVDKKMFQLKVCELLQQQINETYLLKENSLHEVPSPQSEEEVLNALCQTNNHIILEKDDDLNDLKAKIMQLIRKGRDRFMIMKSVDIDNYQKAIAWLSQYCVEHKVVVVDCLSKEDLYLCKQKDLFSRNSSNKGCLAPIYITKNNPKNSIRVHLKAALEKGTEEIKNSKKIEKNVKKVKKVFR